MIELVAGIKLLQNMMDKSWLLDYICWYWCWFI